MGGRRLADSPERSIRIYWFPQLPVRFDVHEAFQFCFGCLGRRWTLNLSKQSIIHIAESLGDEDQKPAAPMSCSHRKDSRPRRASFLQTIDPKQLTVLPNPSIPSRPVDIKIQCHPQTGSCIDHPPRHSLTADSHLKLTTMEQASPGHASAFPRGFPQGPLSTSPPRDLKTPNRTTRTKHAQSLPPFSIPVCLHTSPRT